jgi:hypothetical protein
MRTPRIRIEMDIFGKGTRSVEVYAASEDDRDRALARLQEALPVLELFEARLQQAVPSES